MFQGLKICFKTHVYFNLEYQAFVKNFGLWFTYCGPGLKDNALFTSYKWYGEVVIICFILFG